MKYARRGCLLLVLLFLVGGIAASYLLFHSRGLNRDFDPAVVAHAETRMWKAYYEHNAEELGRQLVTLMREQLGLSLASSLRLTYALGKATMEFGRSQGGYQEKVLPGLVDFYTRAHDLAGGDWDPRAVAQAELDWWVARRTPGEDSAEQVGAKIAHLYTLLYGSSNPHIEKAGLLRAQAAVLRDEGGPATDWDTIEEMLLDSYTELKAGVTTF